MRPACGSRKLAGWSGATCGRTAMPARLLSSARTDGPGPSRCPPLFGRTDRSAGSGKSGRPRFPIPERKSAGSGPRPPDRAQGRSEGRHSRAVSPHWLRHAHASHALDRGAPIHLVQATLGHSSVATTSRYFHARPGESSARFLALETLLAISVPAAAAPRSSRSSPTISSGSLLSTCQARRDPP